MAAREDDLDDLALEISTAIARARRLNLPTSAYMLSMVVVEVSEALKAAAADGGGGRRGAIAIPLVPIDPDHAALFDRKREPAVLQR